MTLLTDWKINLTEDDVLRGQGADPQTNRTSKPALQKAASAALHEGLGKLHPIVILRNIKVSEHRHDQIRLKDGKQLANPWLARRLAGAVQIAAAICTIGLELETLASSQLRENPLLGFALDGLGNAAVENLAQQVCTHIAEEAQAKGQQATTPFSPGEPDWPVEIGQPQIFSMLDPSQAGITLTSGGMMIPRKSLAFVIGLGPAMYQTKLCDLCSMRETCRYRHA